MEPEKLLFGGGGGVGRVGGGGRGGEGLRTVPTQRDEHVRMDFVRLFGKPCETSGMFSSSGISGVRPHSATPPSGPQTNQDVKQTRPNMPSRPRERVQTVPSDLQPAARFFCIHVCMRAQS